MGPDQMHEEIEIPIPVGKEIWTLGCDKHNYILGRKSFKKAYGKKPDRIEFDQNTMSFHSSIESALKQAQKLMVKNTPIKTFEELHAAIKKTGDQLIGMYEGLEEKL